MNRSENESNSAKVGGFLSTLMAGAILFSSKPLLVMGACLPVCICVAALIHRNE